MIINNEDYLEHYGVKGMKWGVRKDRLDREPRKKMTPEQKKALAIKVGIGVGVLTVAAGATYAAYTLSRNGNMDTRLLKAGVKKVGEEAADKVLDEPTSVIHAARGKNIGYKILRDGDTKAPFKQLEESGLLGSGGEGVKPGTMMRFGQNREKIAAVIRDPKGRKDFAGRPLDHSLIVPASMTSGITSIDDVKEKIWPLVEKDYDQFYESSEKEEWER